MYVNYIHSSDSLCYILYILWMVAKSCTTKRMVETPTKILGFLPPISWVQVLANHQVDTGPLGIFDGQGWDLSFRRRWRGGETLKPPKWRFSMANYV